MSYRQSSKGWRSRDALLWAALVGAAFVGALAGTMNSAPKASEGQASSAPTERQLDMLASIDAGETLAGDLSACFSPDTPNEVVEIFMATIDRFDPDRFQGSSRWSNTASGGTGSFGEPITLRYSFVPDGTFIPNGVGEGSANSNLFAWLNGIYGSPATWQSLFAQMFDRWSHLVGIDFVYEPNDDGASMFNASGVIGVRGDLRIGAKTIDGNSGILAYNFFPNGGDMVIDSADSYFNNTGANSRRLRNVTSHEHGHGHGQSHVCPVNASKLMEPFVTTSYDGPRHDDIRGAHDRYGDPFEPDNSSGAATDLGLISVGSQQTPSSVASPSVPNGSRLSIDANSEQDWFEFSTDGASEITVTVTPLGLTYLNGPQNPNGSCSPGSNVNSLTMADLAVQLVDTNGSTVLATASSNGVGVGEEIFEFPSSGADTLFVRVYETGSVAEPQLYGLTIAVAPPPLPGSFNLISPSNGATDVSTGPAMDWSDSSDADDYLLEIDDNVSFASPEVSQVVGTSDANLANGTLAYSTQYFWRVYAQNSVGSTLSSPSVQGFTTEDAPPPSCIGDLDGDDDTDVFDFGILASNFGATGLTPFTGGDMDGDGDVDVFDFPIFAADFGCGA